jgi:hypothetical protein
MSASWKWVSALPTRDGLRKRITATIAAMPISAVAPRRINERNRFPAYVNDAQCRVTRAFAGLLGDALEAE